MKTMEIHSHKRTFLSCGSAFLRGSFALLLLLLFCLTLVGCGPAPRKDLTAEDHVKLAKAIEEDDPNTIQQYLKEGMDANAKDEQNTPYIVRATTKGKSDIVRALLNGRADPNTRGEKKATLLHGAVLGNYPDIVGVLLRWDADVNAQMEDGNTPLHLAATVGNPDIVHTLLEKKADVKATNKAGKTPLDLAREQNQNEAFQILSKATSTR
jgi:ankyrin repeat protein